jgi:O-antigen/teichoic acid export membrane protein
MTFLSNWVVELLYGVAYREAGPVLMIHIWAGVFVALGATSSSWLINENLQQFAFYRSLSGAITNVILNLILIPNYGMVGAAIATVISYMIAGFVFDLFSNKTRRMFFMKIDALFLKGIRIGN